MMMYNPPHVGEILREMYLEPANISVTEAAKRLGVSRQAISRLINEKTGISAGMALRLAQAFGTSPEYWMNMEKQYELWQAMSENEDLKIEPFLIPNMHGSETTLNRSL
jgi:addiction module HigA family antidote